MVWNLNWCVLLQVVEFRLSVLELLRAGLRSGRDQEKKARSKHSRRTPTAVACSRCLPITVVFIFSLSDWLLSRHWTYSLDWQFWCRLSPKNEEANWCQNFVLSFSTRALKVHPWQPSKINGIFNTNSKAPKQEMYMGHIQAWAYSIYG